MAWTSPRTWVAAEVVTAALLNTHLRDNLLELNSTASAWTAWSPTATNTTYSSAFARYKQVGKTITGAVSMVISSAPTGPIGCSFPVSFTSSPFDTVTAVEPMLGPAWAFDVSANVAAVGVTMTDTTLNRMYFFSTTGSPWTTATPFVWANGDSLRLTFTYEIA